MAKLRLSIHPLFFAFGIYFALIGKVFSFLAFVLTALIHELGHYFVSQKYGYELNKIVLMPYGAVISGDITTLKYRDEIIIAFAGPLINFWVVIFFVSLWWLVPDTYAYTDLVVLSNLTLASVNLLPCYPLDGGRILVATLSLYMKRKTALKIAKTIGLSTSIGLFALFVYSCFVGINISILFFSLFMFFGVVFTSKSASYVRAVGNYSIKRFKQGLEIKKIAIESQSTLKDLLRISEGKPVEVVLTKNEKIEKNLSFTEVQKLFTEGVIYDTLDNNVKRLKKN